MKREIPGQIDSTMDDVDVNEHFSDKIPNNKASNIANLIIACGTDRFSPTGILTLPKRDRTYWPKRLSFYQVNSWFS